MDLGVCIPNLFGIIRVGLALGKLIAVAVGHVYVPSVQSKAYTVGGSFSLLILTDVSNHQLGCLP